MANARADVADAEANHQAAVAGPTREERAIADAEVEAAASAPGGARAPPRQDHPARARRWRRQCHRRRGRREPPRRPACACDRGNGQAVFVIQCARRSAARPHGRRKRRCAAIGPGGEDASSGHRTAPLGTFATWQAERAVGDHDRNTLRLRLDLQGDPTSFEPGMSVWLDP